MSLALASKVKSLVLASRPRVFENCPVLGSRTALFFELLKFCRLPEKKILEGVFYWKTPESFFEDFFFWDCLKKNFEDLFFENTCACVFGPWPWPRAFLSLASRGSVLERAVLGLGLFLCPWPWRRASCSRLRLCLLSLSSSTSVFNHNNLCLLESLPFYSVKYFGHAWLVLFEN